MVLRRFADYAASIDGQDLPPSAVHAAKRAVVDWMAATIAGGTQAPAAKLIQAFGDSIGPGGRGGAILYPSGLSADARTAAFINGAAAHTIEFDDIYRDGLYHPGAPVISAAMALAQARGEDGEALLRAVIAGYEVSNRIAVAVNPMHYKFWHTTGTVGAFGAAAAAAAVLGLDAEGQLNAMANAGTLAAGLQQAFHGDSMAKPLHTAQAAETGVKLALAAEQGVTGVPEMLDGPVGFGAAMSHNPDWDAAAATLGRSFTIERMTFKNHAACGHAHAAVDGVLALCREHGLEAKDIAVIRCGTFAKAVEIVGNKEPRTVYEAKFSLPYCAAIAVMTGSVRMDAFRPERLDDPALRNLIAKVTVALDEKIDAEFPTRRAARIAIETTDGRTLEHYAPTRKGDPDNPLSDDELADKFEELISPILGGAGAKDLLTALWALDEARDLRQLPATLPDAAAGAAQ